MLWARGLWADAGRRRERYSHCSGADVSWKEEASECGAPGFRPEAHCWDSVWFGGSSG